MRILSVLLFFCLISPAVVAQTQQAAPSGDDIARHAFDILGGNDAYKHARYFSFTFKTIKGDQVTAFPERFDRVTGDFHVSGRRPDGIPFEATINVKTNAVHGTIEGRAVTGADESKRLYQFAYERYISDTFWLLMPMMMVEPSFQRVYDGPRSDSCGHTWDLVKLTVEVKPGNPPAGIYWAWINRQTGMIEEWDMKPAGMPSDQPPIEVKFLDYRRIAGLLISVRRDLRPANQTIRFDDLQILPATPKDAFK